MVGMKYKQKVIIKIATVIVLFVAVAVFSGCVTASDISRSQYSISKRLHELETSFEATKKDIVTLQQNQADKDVEIAALKSRLREMYGIVEESRNELTAYRDMKTKVNALGDKVNQFHNRLAVVENNSVSAKNNPDVVLSKTGEATHETIKNDKVKAEISNLYKTAYELFKQKKFDRARFEFSSIIKRFPNSEYSADSQFWIAESFFLGKEYENAILEYEKVIKNYPKSDKIANSLFKQGSAFIKLEDKQSAKLIFKQLIKAFPNTSQAKMAQSKLNELK